MEPLDVEVLVAMNKHGLEVGDWFGGTQLLLDPLLSTIGLQVVGQNWSTCYFAVVAVVVVVDAAVAVAAVVDKGRS